MESILRRVRENRDLDKAGAIACFIGIVRGEGLRGGRVEKLVFEAYKEEAERSLARIAEDLLTRPGIVDVRIHHVVGELGVGEDIVYIVVAGSRRDEVFEVLREAVERMKNEAAIWKKEVTDLGEYWVSGE
ncbi:MAG: molybdenum cofactor biosynthesis protein MoaE [Nitrososphaeria archaeon]|nr:molybdenum cofactor biosynthesis protein MoaE [Nitrososphaeria archaeon]MDW8021193.1 molybdenum cofactor biosynthesis protein MoaE [Nitrososphaerota archaeon]